MPKPDFVRQDDVARAIRKRNYLRSRSVSFLILLLIIVSITYVVYQNIGLKDQYSVSEALSSAESLRGKAINLQAKVARIIPETTDNPPAQFWVTDGKGELAITYGSFPYEGFSVGDDVLVAGAFDDNKGFVATRLLRVYP